MPTDLIGQKVGGLLPILDRPDHQATINLLTIRNIPRPSLNFQPPIISTADPRDDEDLNIAGLPGGELGWTINIYVCRTLGRIPQSEGLEMRKPVNEDLPDPSRDVGAASI